MIHCNLIVVIFLEGFKAYSPRTAFFDGFKAAFFKPLIAVKDGGTKKETLFAAVSAPHHAIEWGLEARDRAKVYTTTDYSPSGTMRAVNEFGLFSKDEKGSELRLSGSRSDGLIDRSPGFTLSPL